MHNVHALDMALENATLDEVLATPPSALAGLTEEHDELLAGMGIKTIRDLGSNKYFTTAGVLVGADRCWVHRNAMLTVAGDHLLIADLKEHFHLLVEEVVVWGQGPNRTCRVEIQEDGFAIAARALHPERRSSWARLQRGNAGEGPTGSGVGTAGAWADQPTGHWSSSCW